jgi:hypothetical protein
MKIERVQNWEEVKAIIQDCFSGDDDLINKYHIKAGSPLYDCVDDTFNVLRYYTNNDFEFYKVTEGETIGFIGIEPGLNYLTTFCLKMEHRTEKNKFELWCFIRDLLKNFNCALYKKNQRAITYLIKCGCKVIERKNYNNEPIVILNYKKEETCL